MAVADITASNIRISVEKDKPCAVEAPLFGSDKYMYSFAIPSSILSAGSAKIEVVLSRLVPGKKAKSVYSGIISLMSNQTRKLHDIGWQITLERANLKKAVFNISQCPSPSEPSTIARNRKK